MLSELNEEPEEVVVSVGVDWVVLQGVVVLEYGSPVVVDMIGPGDLETRPDLGLSRSIHVSVDEGDKFAIVR